MQISIRRFDNAIVLDVSGDIDLSSSPEVRKALLRELRDNRIPRVAVNLRKCDISTAPVWLPWWRGSRHLATRGRVSFCLG